MAPDHLEKVERASAVESTDRGCVVAVVEHDAGRLAVGDKDVMAGEHPISAPARGRRRRWLQDRASCAFADQGGSA